MHSADEARRGARRKAVTVTGEVSGLESWEAQRWCGGAGEEGERGAGEGEERERVWRAVRISWGVVVGGVGVFWRVDGVER